MISYPEALSKILASVPTPGSEIVSLDSANARVLAENALADRDYPPFNRATMDGYALQSDGYSREKVYSVTREVLAGQSVTLEPEEKIVRIMTGASVPDGLDAVIKVEESEELSSDSLESKVRFQTKDLKPFHNIARRGEDLQTGDIVLEAGHRLNPTSISLLASIGKSTVRVGALPTVAIISTGDEVVPVNQRPLPWQIRDSNSYTILSQLARLGIQSKNRILVADDEESLRKEINSAMESDVLVLSGGVSMGSRDLVPGILESIRVREIFHKTAIKPGKPIWFGMKDNTAVFGLPGNPFSVQVCARIFLQPYLLAFQGLPPKKPMMLPLWSDRKKKNTMSEFFPVRFDTRESTGLAPLPTNGSGDITAGLHSDGIALHPPEAESLAEGEIVEFYPW